MPLRSAKRIYNIAALEAWFTYLQEPWETHFGRDDLRQGRQFYREGLVGEFEITEKVAIVRTKRNKKELYTVIERDAEDRWAVRSSTEDKTDGNALAVAGMYEIEELIADEIAPVVPEKKGDSGRAEDLADSLPENTVNRKKEPPSRPLHTVFGVNRKGLILRVYWENPDKSLEPVFLYSEKELDTELDNLGFTFEERENLIRLTSFARKAGFRLRSKRLSHIMRDFNRISPFLIRELKRWKQYFKVREEGSLAGYRKGIQAAAFEVLVDLDQQGIQVGWQFAAGGQKLGREDGLALMKNFRHPVSIPGVGLIKIRAEQIDALEGWRELFMHTNGLKQANYLLLSLFSNAALNVKLSENARIWYDSLIQIPVEQDSNLPSYLRDYQRSGVQWMRHVFSRDCHCLLADEMGLGKTLQALTLIDDGFRQTGEGGNASSLVVCPASVVPVWRSEIRRYFPHLSVSVLSKSQVFSKGESPRLWLASYTQLRRHKRYLDALVFKYAILDEAQFIKNPDAKVSQACMAIQAQRRLTLTGTPLENRHLDLWTIFRFLMPGLLGTRRNFQEAVKRDPERLTALLRNQIQPFVLRRNKTEVASELPPKLTMSLVCPMSDMQKREYKRLVEEGISTLGDTLVVGDSKRRMDYFALLTRLRQVCCDPGLLPWITTGPGHSGKIEVLLEKLADVVANGSKVVVFSQFVSLIKRTREAVCKQYKDIPVFSLTGQTRNREKPVREFQEQKGSAIIFISLKAGGTGINLQGAEYVFLMDPWWNPAVEEQAVDRVHRIGQKSRVFVYRMITEGTIEGKIDALKLEKKALFQNLIGELPDLTDLSHYFTTLSQLISLSQNGNGR